MSYVKCESLIKIYEHNLVALQDISFELEAGQQLAILGEAQSGKSTLIHILGAMEPASAGSIQIGDFRLSDLTRTTKRQFLQHEIAFLWAEPQRNLIPYLTVRENIQAVTNAPLPDGLGLTEKLDQPIEQLSLLEKQVVALARAVAKGSNLLLADEPTRDLAEQDAETFFKILSEQPIAAIVATQRKAIQPYVARVLGLQSSVLIEAPLLAEDTTAASIDEGGRVQVPPAYLAKIGIEKYAALEVQDHKLVIKHHPKPSVDETSAK